MKNTGFLKLGEHNILDFCNTEAKHGLHCQEFLITKNDYQNFLKEFYQIDTTLNQTQFVEVLKFRSLLRKFFEELISHRELDANTKSEMNKTLQNYRLEYEVASDGVLNSIFKNFVNTEKKYLTVIVGSLIDFLQNHQFLRLKKCKNENCSHLFYDRSKNNSREWCSMKSCGNIMKARAFYKRNKKQDN